MICSKFVPSLFGKQKNVRRSSRIEKLRPSIDQILVRWNRKHLDASVRDYCRNWKERASLSQDSMQLSIETWTAVRPQKELKWKCSRSKLVSTSEAGPDTSKCIYRNTSTEIVSLYCSLYSTNRERLAVLCGRATSIELHCSIEDAFQSSRVQFAVCLQTAFPDPRNSSESAFTASLTWFAQIKFTNHWREKKFRARIRAWIV